jgi:hypothetical protein
MILSSASFGVVGWVFFSCLGVVPGCPRSLGDLFFLQFDKVACICI